MSITSSQSAQVEHSLTSTTRKHSVTNARPLKTKKTEGTTPGYSTDGYGVPKVEQKFDQGRRRNSFSRVSGFRGQTTM